MRRKLTWILAVALLLPLLGWAQGSSAIKVTVINVTPASFQNGAALTVAIDYRNAGTRASGPGTAFVQVFKANTFLATDLVWHTEQPVGAIPAGGTGSLTFTTKFTVPNINTDKFVFRAGIIDPPNEFCDMASRTFNRTCTYQAMPVIFLPNKINLRELRIKP